MDLMLKHLLGGKMTQQAENYLILKPIAERFSRVASEITDDDIKYIIKQVMKEKISDALDFSVVQEKLTDWVDNNSDQIVHAMQDAIMERFNLPRDYEWY
jgi:hypothetical protein